MAKDPENRLENPASRFDLQELYGAGYYHGKNSGYPPEGYRLAHPEWGPWLDLLARISPPPGVFFDSGTAFGYLPEMAAARGYRALGSDISDYALRQEASFREILLQGNAESIPLAADSVDIFCLFDVLEHLRDPVATLREAARVLKPNGLLAGATPDPIFFAGEEETHCFERPPSFWIEQLRRLGLKVAFRFSNIPENFQFLAAPSSSRVAGEIDIFQHDHFSFCPDILRVEGEQAAGLTAVLREGWAPLEDSGRTMQGSSASIYLLNSCDSPLESRLRLELKEDCPPFHLRIRFNSLVLTNLAFLPNEKGGPISFGPFSIPSGGHHLHLETSPLPPNPVTVASLSLEASRIISPDEHTLSLPFDLYQRYRFAAELAGHLQPGSILDAGGTIGDQGGHLASSRDFFHRAAKPAPRLISTDLRHCDHPDHLPGNALRLPFPDDSFELAISIDVLEHVPPPDRIRFLEELDRVSSRWIILGAPFASSPVARAESVLSSDLGLHFLEEHSGLGLPEEALVTEFFREKKGRKILRFSNGYLPRWFLMLPLTQMLFSEQDYRTFTQANRYYNQNFYSEDCRPPGYRTFFLISRAPLPDDIKALLQSRPSFQDRPDPELIPDERDWRPFPFYRDFLELNRSRLREAGDLAFLLASREKHIRILQEELESWEGSPILRTIRKISRIVRLGGKGRSGKS